MKTKIYLYTIKTTDGKWLLPFPALNDHFASMAFKDFPNADGAHLYRSGEYNTETGRICGRSKIHEVL